MPEDSLHKIDTTRIQMDIGCGDQPRPVEFKLRRDVVEIYVDDRHRAVFDRDRLAAWMREPFDRLEDEGVVWTLDSHRRVIFALSDTRADTAGWLLPPAVEQSLRDQL